MFYGILGAGSQTADTAIVHQSSPDAAQIAGAAVSPENANIRIFGDRDIGNLSFTTGTIWIHMQILRGMDGIRNGYIHKESIAP